MLIRNDNSMARKQYSGQSKAAEEEGDKAILEKEM